MLVQVTVALTPSEFRFGLATNNWTNICQQCLCIANRHIFTIQYNEIICIAHSGQLFSRIWIHII